ncbi:RNase H domain-containing protein [Abeliophyllum distichum]|uniref:RNase H domain-containing protein n=1 Tax=Abeliophyllum distichum TaxID=126358 RepID=A0ABD1P1V4_9LAMI
MASRCQCCSEIETIQHVFIDSSVAHQVWQHFSSIFGIPLKLGMMRSIVGLAESPVVSSGGSITLFFYCIQANSFSLCIGVGTLTLPHILVLLLFLLPPTPLLLFIGVSRQLDLPRSISMDASEMDLRVAGGVIRFHTGHCIRAFSTGYGEIFILEAELRANLQGIELARRMGLVDLWIETDSTLAIHCISRGGGPWVIQSMLRRIRHLLSFDRGTVFHIFREENQVANYLAFEGWDRRHYQEYGPSDLPRRFCGLLQTNRFGLPSVRDL